MTIEQLQNYLNNRGIYNGATLHLKNNPKLRVKVTSLKIWKKNTGFDGNPQFRIGWKNGLYKYGDIVHFCSLHQEWLTEKEARECNLI